MKNPTDQSTRVRTGREEQTRGYANMPTTQIAHGFEKWDADVEVDGDELARLRDEETPESPTAHTVESSFRLAVVDAGEKSLPFGKVNGQRVRHGWETTFDPTTDTVAVFRDASKSVLGHTPMPAIPPLTEAQAQRIARNTFARGLDGDLDTKPWNFWDDTNTLEAYLDEVADAIEHPSWCQQAGCWDRHPLHSVEHTRKITPHEWEHEGLEHTVDAGLTMFSETVTVGPDDTTDMRVRIESSEMGEVTLLGTPHDFRKLGQYLVTAADDLEWEHDDYEAVRIYNNNTHTPTPSERGGGR